MRLGVQEGKGRIGVVAALRWWQWCFAALFVIMLMAISPRGKSTEFSHLAVGLVSPAKIIAPFDFEILKSTDEIKREREEAIEAIPPIFVVDDSAHSRTLNNIRAFSIETAGFFSRLDQEWLSGSIDTAREWDNSQAAPFLKGSKAIADKYGLSVGWEDWRLLIGIYLREPVPNAYLEFFERLPPRLMASLYSGRVISSVDSTILRKRSQIAVHWKAEEKLVATNSLLFGARLRSEIRRTLESSFPALFENDSTSITKASRIFAQFTQPNLVYSESETESARASAIHGVPLAKGFVKQDELIVDRHIRITDEHLAKLNSLAVKRAEKAEEVGGVRSLLPLAGQLLLTSILTLFLLMGIARVRPDVWQNWRSMTVIFLILAIVLVSFSLFTVRFGLSRQLLPAAFGALLLTVLFGRRMAALGVVVMALTGGYVYGNDFQTATLALASGSVAMFSLRSLKARSDIIRTSIPIAAASIAVLTGFHLTAYNADGSLLTEIEIALASAFILPMLVLGVIPLIENGFGITTDLTLLELIDLNRPLLRTLAIKSPGTYHHSLMVGSLAEAAAREIGANPLLVRAGAYYHDIGKMDIKEYFIENQETGSENIHDRLEPEHSAEIIIDHVTRGLQLAAEHRLPVSVRNFITEHHGKTTLAFFYAKAERELGKRPDEDLFRYPGPKPQSKETAILMLVDGIEAASRSLNRPNPAELKEMVDRLVSIRVAEGDLDESPLTLNEISRIKAALVTHLNGIHHQRIEYPDRSATASVGSANATS
jgi:putative nucleotidyltransferase with HDIG domain